jgi:hypothetical protein
MMSPNLLLWIAASFVALGLLISAAGHRQTSLIDALKAFVDRHIRRQATKQASSENPSANSADS